PARAPRRSVTGPLLAAGRRSGTRRSRSRSRRRSDASPARAARSSRARILRPASLRSGPAARSEADGGGGAALRGIPGPRRPGPAGRAPPRSSSRAVLDPNAFDEDGAAARPQLQALRMRIPGFGDVEEQALVEKDEETGTAGDHRHQA